MSEENSQAKVYSAFIKAQKEFGAALKTSTNPHFKSKYADLASCVDAVISALNNNGIGLTQFIHESESGVTVETVFLHESGEVLTSGQLNVPVVKNDAQGYGSALTYARRYSLMTACGIAPEDDDGNAATKAAPRPASAKSVPQDIFDKLDSITQDKIRNYAMEAISLAEIKNDTAGCYEYIQSLQLDSDLYAALWSQFDSKLRASLKKYKEIKNG